VIDLLRQRARPYLFSNSLPPSIVAAGIEALRLVGSGADLRAQLFENTRFWRKGLEDLGFDLLPGEHPIVPIMLGEAHLAQDMAAQLFDEGVYVSGFFFPVVPRGQARIRTQMNAALTRDELERALGAFEKVGKSLGVIS
jgi:glycine C-acetyltransferase